MPRSPERQAALAQFIEAWSGMSSLFGFNVSTARVSALLIGAVEPLSLGAIAEQLGMSRGNASMCLKELRGWGVAQRVSLPGDRQDYYVSEGDLFRQTIAIARERKRREFDPAARRALGALQELAQGASPEEAARVAEIRSYVETVDRMGHDLLENESAALALIGLLQAGFGRDSEDASD
jgi:DNA-binding transcriptional regulator GbsR (MarR family)